MYRIPVNPYAMSTQTTAFIFVLLVLALGLFLFGGPSKQTEAPAAPSNGTMMNINTAAHVMPDGTTMTNDAGMDSTHMMSDGTMMDN